MVEGPGTIAPEMASLALLSPAQKSLVSALSPGSKSASKLND